MREEGSEDTGGDNSFDLSQCGDKQDLLVWKSYEYWCEGVLFSSIGLCGELTAIVLGCPSTTLPPGLLSNIACIVTLLSADMRKQTFNQMLAILSVVDIL